MDGGQGHCSTSYKVQDSPTPESDLALDVSSTVEEPWARPCEETKAAQGNWFICWVPQGRGITRSDSFTNNLYGLPGTSQGRGGGGGLKTSESGYSL